MQSISTMSKYKIVIIEHDEEAFVFMQKGLSDLFEILGRVSDVSSLLLWLNQNSDNLPHVILVEAYLPGQRGYEIIPLLQSNPGLSHIPVIVTSTILPDSTIKNCLDQGALFISKPESISNYKLFADMLHRLTEKKIY